MKPRVTSDGRREINVVPNNGCDNEINEFQPPQTHHARVIIIYSFTACDMNTIINYQFECSMSQHFTLLQYIGNKIEVNIYVIIILDVYLKP